jgi:hypothetical protein
MEFTIDKNGVLIVIKTSHSIKTSFLVSKVYIQE